MKNRAFTLIELLVVISIIGLLASVVMAALNTARVKGSVGAGEAQSMNLFHTLADSEVLQLDFNECSGSTAYDLSGLGNNGTISGTPTWVSSYNNQGCALSFDGSTKYVAVGGLANLQSTDTTFSAWVYPTASNLNRGIIEKELQYKYSIANGVLTGLTSCNGTGWASNVSGGTVPVNQWSFVVFVIDSTNAKASLYLNGQQVAAGSIGCSITGWNTNAVGVGYRGNSLNDMFAGSIDEAHIYTRTLTAAEIRQTFLAEAPAHGIALADFK